MKTETCSKCGAEVRYGVRGGIRGWLHRDPDVDHLPLFGKLWTPEDQVSLDAAVLEMAARGKSDKKKADSGAEEDQAPDAWTEVPEPFVTAQPVGPDDFPARSGIRQIHSLVTKTDGWEVASFTLAIGPYVGGRGQVLSISDSVKMVMGGPTIEHGYADPLEGWVDSGRRVAVASWRDGAFDFAYTGILKDGVVTTEPANSMALKAWIKETP